MEGEKALSQSGVSPKDRICLYSGKSHIQIKVSFVITCKGEDIPMYAQLKNMPIQTPHVQKWWKVSTPGRRF